MITQNTEFSPLRLVGGQGKKMFQAKGLEEKHQIINNSCLWIVGLWVILFCCIFFYMPKCFIAEGNGNPLQYSCLENPMEGGAWWATIHGFAKSQTQQSNFSLTQLLYNQHNMCRIQLKWSHSHQEQDEDSQCRHIKEI